MIDALKEYVLASRPWSFTAAIIPVIITAAVLETSFSDINVYRALAVGVAVQAGANLTNTYYDFVNGVDTKENSGEKTLFEPQRKVTSTGIVIFSIMCYVIGIAAVAPLVDTVKIINWGNGLVLDSYQMQLLTVFGTGIALAFFYTANPVGLKYRALGDITIFLCFGPLLMQCTSLLLVHQMHPVLLIYSIPVGLLTEAILHANNARDIKADTEAGATTIATLIGHDWSYVVYICLLVGSYISTLLISLFLNWACIITLISVPLALNLRNLFLEKKMSDLPEETAKMHLPFGVLMFLGVLFSKQGFLSSYL